MDRFPSASGLLQRLRIRRRKKSSLPDRFLPCSLLQAKGIPFCIFMEDALALFGVPTLVYNLYLVVPDIYEVAYVLEKAGYERIAPDLNNRNIPQFHAALALPPPKGKGASAHPGVFTIDTERSVVLLPAAQWFYTLPDSVPTTWARWFPTPLALYTALVRKWLSLDRADDSLRRHLAFLIEDFYRHLDNLVGPYGFELQLPAALRPFHVDQLYRRNRMELSTRRCQLHYLRRMPHPVEKESCDELNTYR